MTKKHAIIQALSIICIGVITAMAVYLVYDLTVVSLGIIALAGLGGYSVRSAGKCNESPPKQP